MYIIVIDDRRIYGPFPSQGSAQDWMERVADDDDWIVEENIPTPNSWSIVELIIPDDFEASDFDDFMRDQDD